MANIVSPLPYINKREFGLIPNVRSQLFNSRLHAAKNLYRKDLSCHFGCVNAIEFSNNGELLVSGGDDRRVMLWQLGQAVLDYGAPVSMRATHESNIFSLGITSDNQKIYSGGNDDVVIVHDVENKTPIEVLQHPRAICSLSIDPFNQQVVATAGNDGRLLLFDTRQSAHESLVISRSRKAFHGVMFHPQQAGLVVSANARDGVALWDLRSPKHPLIRYADATGNCHYHSMSVRFNSTGTHILALRRRQSPVLYNVRSPEPVAELYHQDYYNSCTMKSCCFAGEDDQFALSGSDDFNLYMWKITNIDPENENLGMPTVLPHMVLYGHRSIVNQVRYNPQYCLIASSGVEKIIKVWSAVEYPRMRGTLLEEAQGSDNPREIYSHEEYVSLVHHSGQYISHNYAEQSTSEDPRMMAFFDSLVQRELECLAEESDSLDGSSTGGGTEHHDSDSSGGEQIVTDFLRMPKRGTRSQRCPNRLAHLVAQRYAKQKRGSGNSRRNKHSRNTLLGKSKAKTVSGTSTKGKRTPARRTRGPRRHAPRAMNINNYPRHNNFITMDHLLDPLGVGETRPLVRRNHTRHSRISAPSSERTDSDDAFYRTGRVSDLRQDGIVNPPFSSNLEQLDLPQSSLGVGQSSLGMGLSRSRISAPSSERNDSDDVPTPHMNTGRIIRHLRRRINMTRTTNKRKTKGGTYRKPMNLRNNGNAQDSSDNNLTNFDNNFEDNAQPSTSSGYRGQPTPGLFRIAEADSDDNDDQSTSSVPASPRNTTNNIPNNLVSIIPTPINGSRDSLGDTLAAETTPERRTRRNRRNGRLSFQRSSQSVETTPQAEASTSNERLSPYQTARFMNETNESEIGESSEDSPAQCLWPSSREQKTPEHSDSGVGTVAGSSTRNNIPIDDVSDDPAYQVMKHAVATWSRVKKARRNYRNRMGSDTESDSNGTDN